MRSHIKVCPRAAVEVGDNQDMEQTKGGSTPKYIEANGMLVRIPVTTDGAHDCKKVCVLLSGTSR